MISYRNCNHRNLASGSCFYSVFTELLEVDPSPHTEDSDPLLSTT